MMEKNGNTVFPSFPMCVCVLKIILNWKQIYITKNNILVYYYGGSISWRKSIIHAFSVRVTNDGTCKFSYIPDYVFLNYRLDTPQSTMPRRKSPTKKKEEEAEEAKGVFPADEKKKGESTEMVCSIYPHDKECDNPTSR